MQITILDTVTGKTVTVKKLPEYPITDGDWSCDCNRSLAFIDETFYDDLDAAIHALNPNLRLQQSACFGEKRFIVIKAECDLLEEFLYLNRFYDETLVAKSIPNLDENT